VGGSGGAGSRRRCGLVSISRQHGLHTLSGHFVAAAPHGAVLHRRPPPALPAAWPGPLRPPLAVSVRREPLSPGFRAVPVAFRAAVRPPPAPRALGESPLPPAPRLATRPLGSRGAKPAGRGPAGSVTRSPEAHRLFFMIFFFFFLKCSRTNWLRVARCGLRVVGGS